MNDLIVRKIGLPPTKQNSSQMIHSKSDRVGKYTFEHLKTPRADSDLACSECSKQNKSAQAGMSLYTCESLKVSVDWARSLNSLIVLS